MQKYLIITATLAIIFLILYLFFKPTQTKPILESSIVKETLPHNGKLRSYVYYRPKGLPENPAMVIALHRARSNGSEFRELMNYRYDELADKYKFIVLYPDGYEGNWNDCRKAPKDSAHKLNINDTDYINTLIDLFSKKYSIDKRKVYATGFSAGGSMCLKLASEIPWKIAKIAPTLTQMPVTENYNCKQIIKPISLLIVNGTEDPISPYEGGEVSILKIIKQGRVLSVNETINSFLKLNNLKDKPEISIYPSQITKNQIWIEKKFWHENNKFSLLQLIVHGGGHTLPGADTLPSFIFGKTYKDFLIADEIIDFFMKK